MDSDKNLNITRIDRPSDYVDEGDEEIFSHVDKWDLKEVENPAPHA